MKRNRPGKLAVSRETLRSLAGKPLRRIYGGENDSRWSYCCPTYTCPPISDDGTCWSCGNCPPVSD